MRHYEALEMGLYRLVLVLPNEGGRLNLPGMLLHGLGTLEFQRKLIQIIFCKT